jgi:asparagine synthase (glutamine-hydrolysing)
MCGICGYVTTNPARVGPDALTAMNAAIAHRGPDDEGVYIDGGVGLAHRRLAILDLSPLGHQPMQGPEDTWITYNGEVYNFQSIAQELAGFGVHTRTRSDTEVMLLALHRFGLEQALKRFNGMFAFGYWDGRTRTLTLVRDRLGVKPLYYYADRECIVFASEMRALEQWGGLPRDIDIEALDLYVSYEHVPSPMTMRRGVRQLEPGSLLQWRDGRLSVRRWWHLTVESGNGHSRSLDDYADECRERLREATRLRLISDAPLGALLSGGIDSSAVVSLMAAEGPPPKTFSIGFDDASYNELDAARLVARHVGADHHEEILVASPETALDAIAQALDEPLADVSLIPTYMVSRMARRHVTVALSGDGGDEIFAGYDWYRAASLADRWRRVPGPVRYAFDQAMRRVPPSPKKKGLVNKLKRFSEGTQMDPSLEHVSWQLFAGSVEKRALYRGELAALARSRRAETWGKAVLAAAPTSDPLTRRQWADVQLYLPDDILTKVDRASMAVALEARSPFLDYNVVEFALRVPARYRMDRSTRKLVLKRAIAPLVPAGILDRRKEGFSMPMKHWLRQELLPLANDLLTGSVIADHFDPQTCRRLIDEHKSGRFNHAHLLWTLMIFAIWRQRVPARVPVAV